MINVISFYKFVPIADPAALQVKWREACSEYGIQGTILIAKEGINGMLAGSQASIAAVKALIHSDERFTGLIFKESYTSELPFRRMLVKVKKYALTMRKDVDPIGNTGEYLPATTFKEWQDAGKEMLILDTRNDYEVAMGTFKNAINPHIKTFDQFPEWIDQNFEDHKDKTIVTFCTGGIRCEKATAYMKEKGFKQVYQLEGGIITYLEQTLDAADNHWVGDCVVFDKRKAVTKALEPSEKTICYVCLYELHAENTAPQKGPAGELCKSCFESLQTHHAGRLAKGLQKSQENRQTRAAFLKEQKAKDLPGHSH